MSLNIVNFTVGSEMKRWRPVVLLEEYTHSRFFLCHTADHTPGNPVTTLSSLLFFYVIKYLTKPSDFVENLSEPNIYTFGYFLDNTLWSVYLQRALPSSITDRIFRSCQAFLVFFV